MAAERLHAGGVRSGSATAFATSRTARLLRHAVVRKLVSANRDGSTSEDPRTGKFSTKLNSWPEDAPRKP